MEQVQTETQNYLWRDRKRTLFGLPWSFTKYALTNERLFIEQGLLRSTENEVRLYRILDVQLSRTLNQKIWGLGTIKVSSSDRTLGNFEIKNIKKSKYVKELLSELVEKQRDSKRVVNRELMGGTEIGSEGFDDDGPDFI